MDKSPIKQSPTSSPLPPVPTETLTVKKRRLDPSSPTADRITPEKNPRSFSTPTRSGNRTPSLQDKPIPILSPPTSSPVKSRKLDKEVRNWKRLVDLAQQAGKYESQDEADKLERLITEWREAAQGAAKYLLNEADQKIEAVGGIEEYNKQVNEQDYEFDVDSLNEQQRAEYEEMMNSVSNKENEDSGMKRMCQSLGVDYSLLFP